MRNQANEWEKKKNDDQTDSFVKTQKQSGKTLIMNERVKKKN